jgi:hypothetical protein
MDHCNRTTFALPCLIFYLLPSWHRSPSVSGTADTPTRIAKLQVLLALLFVLFVIALVYSRHTHQHEKQSVTVGPRYQRQRCCHNEFIEVPFAG